MVCVRNPQIEKRRKIAVILGVPLLVIHIIINTYSLRHCKHSLPSLSIPIRPETINLISDSSIIIMAKFSFLALAAAASASAVGAVLTKNIKLGNRNLRRGDPATEALLKKAVPYKRNDGQSRSNNSVSRHLEENNNEIDGSYYIQFSECMDVKLYDEDLFGENTINYVKNGQIIAAKSYVLFHVCQENSCYLESDDDLYLVDLATYLVNIAQYYANKRTDYCEQCQEYEDYCNPQQEEEAAAEEEENNAEAENAEQEPEEEGGQEGEGEYRKEIAYEIAENRKPQSYLIYPKERDRMWPKERDKRRMEVCVC